MPLTKKFHTIWISTNKKLPDQALKNLLEWKKALPKDWTVILWTNTKEVDPDYLFFLANNGIKVLDIDPIIKKVAPYLSKILLYFLEAYRETKYHQFALKLFSDIFRIIL